MRNYKYFAKATAWIVGFILLGVLLFFVSHLAYLFSYGDFKELSHFRGDLARAFWVGIRFDVKVLTFAYLPAMTIPFAAIFLGNKLFSTFRRIVKIYGITVTSVFAVLMVIDYYFYSFYTTRISIIVFGFFEDDTLAVIKTLWTDFPLISVLIGLAVAVFLIAKASQQVVRERQPASLLLNGKPLLQGIAMVLFVGLYFLGLRGTLAIIPLDGRHATISDNTFVNALCNNAVFSLKTAYSDKKRDSISVDTSAILQKLRFPSASSAIANYLGLSASGSLGTSALIASTPKNPFLEENPPSVVFVLMEGMSSYYMNLHSPENNLLGALEAQLGRCYVYRNFLPAYNGTIYSLENLLVGTPQSPLSQSEYQTLTLESSVAKPFKQKGYSTTFITGGKMGWRSMDKFIGKQYIDKVEAEPSLLKEYPDAKTGEWGVHDEHLFDRMFSILENANGKPQLIFAMTISHHSPYDIPRSYAGYPISLTDGVKGRLKTPEEVAIRCFRAYQYANNCLGRFIERVSSSPLTKNTIIVATGDHNVLQLFDFSDKELLMKYSVPLVMYIPDDYRPKGTVNTRVFASHKDIFPTVFGLSLSEATYLKTGCNLFSPEARGNFGIHRYSIAMDSVGCVDFTSRTPLYFRWSETDGLLETSTVAPDLHLQALMRKSEAYIASMNLFIMDDLAAKARRGPLERRARQNDTPPNE